MTTKEQELTKKLQDNRLYKMALIILLAIFVYLEYDKEEIGRYVWVDNSAWTILDTSTGTIYSSMLSLNPKNEYIKRTTDSILREIDSH